MNDREVIETVEQAIDRALKVYSRYSDLKFEGLNRQLSEINVKIDKHIHRSNVNEGRIVDLEKENLIKEQALVSKERVEVLEEKLQIISTENVTQARLRSYMYKLGLLLTGLISAASALIILLN